MSPSCLDRPTFLPIVLLLLAGCVAPGSGDPGSVCVGGKCDDASSTPPALSAAPLDGLVRCRAVVDPSPDAFFARHELRCDVDAPEGVIVSAVYFDLVRPDDGRVDGASRVSDDALNEEIRAGTFFESALPLRVRITVAFYPDGGSPFELLYWGYERTIRDRAELATLTEESPLSVDLPLEVWPVVLWPDPATLETWGATRSFLLADFRYAYAVDGSADLAVGGPRPLTQVEGSSTAFRPADLPELAELTRRRFALLLPRGERATPPRLEITLGDQGSTDVIGPGYYVVHDDGTAVLTAPNDLPALHVAMDPTEPPPDEPPPDEPPPDEPPPDEPPPDEPPADPCMGACDSADVCVAAECVALADQTQRLVRFSTTSCEAPSRTCDEGQDTDCAADHVCVGGLCRRLACQNQDFVQFSVQSCVAPDQPCESDVHCDNEHTCVQGLCRRTVCQNQDLVQFSSVSCMAADQVCERDVDCASDHACVFGNCRRLACQNQDLVQFSSTSCQPADQPCEVDAHCAPDHVCGASQRCARVACGG